MGTQKNHLNETVLLSTQNTCYSNAIFHGKGDTIAFKMSYDKLNLTLIIISYQMACLINFILNDHLCKILYVLHASLILIMQHSNCKHVREFSIRDFFLRINPQVQMNKNCKCKNVIIFLSISLNKCFGCLKRTTSLRRFFRVPTTYALVKK